MACKHIDVQFAHVNGVHDKQASSRRHGPICAPGIQAQPKLAEMITESLPHLRLTQKRARFTLAIRARGQ